MDYYSKNEKDTADLGAAFGEKAEMGNVFCLIGDLGAGKTVFSKGFAKGLNIKQQITSPTFTILNEYEGRLPLYHFDAYRLNGSKDTMCFDFDEYFESGVCLIEWADNILDVIPKYAYYIVFERVGDGSFERRISVSRKA